MTWLLGLGAIVAAFLVMVVATPLTIAFGWYTGEVNLRSFQHVKQTYQEAFDDANALDALARQACTASKAVGEAKSTGDLNTVNQREDQLLAIENNYNRVKGEYDSYMSDHFRGKIIHPASLPIPYPELGAKKQEVCA